MLPRRTLAATVIAVLPLVAACGVGRNTTTDKERQTPYIAGGEAGSMLVTAATLVPSQAAVSGAADSTPTPSPSASDTGSASADGYLVVSIVNRGSQADQLTGVLVQGASVTPGDQSPKALTVPPSQAVTFGDPEFGGDQNSLQVSGLSQPLSVGTAVPVTFQFRDAGSVTVQVLVRATDSFGTTATASPPPLTGSYPAASEQPEGPPKGG